VDKRGEVYVLAKVEDVDDGIHRDEIGSDQVRCIQSSTLHLEDTNIATWPTLVDHCQSSFGQNTQLKKDVNNMSVSVGK
jgi:hypothetical protein